jgi:hypothetical protein
VFIRFLLILKIGVPLTRVFEPAYKTQVRF